MRYRDCAAFLVLCVFLVLAVSEALSSMTPEEGTANNATLPEMVVQGEKALSPHQSGVDLEEATGRISQTPVDVMQQEPGLDLQRKGLMIPNSKMIKLRGFDTEKTLVTFDGRPINGAGVFGGYQVDWAQMPLVDVKRIEITKGALSAEYGNTIGGVINLVPKKPGEELQLEIGAGIKSYNTRQMKSYASGRFNPFQPGGHTSPWASASGPASWRPTGMCATPRRSERTSPPPCTTSFRTRAM